MIVVIGALALRGTDATPEAAGLAGRAASAAAAAGARVEVVAKVGEGPAGDAVLLALAKAGIGHVATLRDAIHRTPRLTPARDEDATLDLDTDPGEEPDASARGAGSTTEAPTLEPADVALALRYLGDYQVVLVLEPPHPDVVHEAATAAGWAGAHLVVAATGIHGVAAAAALPDDALVLELDPVEMASGADDGPDGLAPMLGRYAAAVDGGADPATAFAALTAAATAATAATAG